MRRIAAIVLSVMSCISCARGGWTAEEKALVSGSPDVMRVLVVDNPQDSVVLRWPCLDFDAEMLRSTEYQTLASKMISTVTSPEQDGVGIAGPQVGISRRIVAVQRFDKEGEPFEVYPNIRIVEFRGEKEPGPEGCLSVPGRRGEVLRYRDIDIRYTSPRQTLVLEPPVLLRYSAAAVRHPAVLLGFQRFTIQAAGTLPQDDSYCIVN